MCSIVSRNGRALCRALRRSLGQEVVANLVDLRVVEFQVGALRTDIRRRHKETTRQISLDVQIPLLYVPSRVIAQVGDRKVLNRLRCVLLRANGAQGTADGRHDLRQKRGIDGVYWYSAVDCSGERRRRVIHQVVVRVQTEGDVVWNPKNPVAATNDGLLIQAVCKPHSRRNVGFVERNVSSFAGTYEEHVPTKPR